MKLKLLNDWNLVVDKKNQIYALNTKIQVNTSSDGLYRVYHQEIKANMKTHLYTFLFCRKLNTNLIQRIQKQVKHTRRTPEMKQELKEE